MAKINQQNLVITLSSLMKDADVDHPILTEDTLAQLESVISELAGAGVIVEIAQA